MMDDDEVKAEWLKHIANQWDAAADDRTDIPPYRIEWRPDQPDQQAHWSHIRDVAFTDDPVTIAKSLRERQGGEVRIVAQTVVAVHWAVSPKVLRWSLV